MARPGFVLEVDERTPALAVYAGDEVRAARLPLGARVVYPPEPLAGVLDLRASVAQALSAPVGSEPLLARLRPGMRLTVAFNDNTTPAPRMREPDVRATIAEGVLTLAAQAGVDDVRLVCARGLRRRMTDTELHRLLGERVFRSFFADGRLTQHDAEDPAGLARVSTTAAGEDIQINRYAAEADLLVFVHVVTGPDGGAAAAVTGLGSTATITRGDPLEGLSFFQIEAVVDHRAPSGPLELVGKREWEWSLAERATWTGLLHGLPLISTRARRRLMHAATAANRVLQVTAGDPEQVALVSRDCAAAQRRVEVEGQVDVGLIGVPDINPYSVGSVTNPILAAWQGLQGTFGAHTGRPLVRPGGALVLYHPMRQEFSALHHPSYGDFFADVLAAGPEAEQLRSAEAAFGTDDWYRHLYRTGYAFHGVHPLRLWSELAAARAHCGDVVWIGADRSVAARLGFRAASTLADALEIVASTVGRSPSISYLHPPTAWVDVR
jgi:hypothetical protein